MSQSHPESSDTTPHVSSVSPGDIEGFERETLDDLELYTQLFEKNPELAVWLRRKAADLAPDLDDRERFARLALQLAGILIRAEDIHELEALFIRDTDAAKDQPQPIPHQQETDV